MNEIGREQARLLAGALRDIPFDRAVSSDSIRAVETIKIALGDRPIEVETDPNLREFNAGAFEGLTWDEIRAQYPDAVTRMNSDWFGFVFPGGESRGQMAERAAAAVQRLLDDGRGSHILIGAHGMSVRGILHHHFPAGRRASHGLYSGSRTPASRFSGRSARISRWCNSRRCGAPSGRRRLT
ncbi:MAG: histidine phosphatase family protein [Chloroflexi bacterium]|nr:histidine phosphatase family protein [Chloroflexota bacterium]